MPKSRRADRRQVLAAGGWPRFGAAFVDLAVLALFSVFVALVARLVFGVELPKSKALGIDYLVDFILSDNPAVTAGLFFVVVAAFLYFSLLVGRFGWTVGKLCFGLRVIDKYGEPPRIITGIIRAAGMLLSAVFFMLGFIWIAFDSEKRGLHDYLAGTYVIRSEASR